MAGTVPCSSVAGRLEHDRDALMSLPPQPFDAVSWHNHKADKYVCVKFASNHYQIGGRCQRRNIEHERLAIEVNGVIGNNGVTVGYVESGSTIAVSNGNVIPEVIPECKVTK